MIRLKRNNIEIECLSILSVNKYTPDYLLNYIACGNFEYEFDNYGFKCDLIVENDNVFVISDIYEIEFVLRHNTIKYKCCLFEIYQASDKLNSVYQITLKTPLVLLKHHVYTRSWLKTSPVTILKNLLYPLQNKINFTIKSDISDDVDLWVQDSECSYDNLKSFLKHWGLYLDYIYEEGVYIFIVKYKSKCTKSLPVEMKDIIEYVDKTHLKPAEVEYISYDLSAGSYANYSVKHSQINNVLPEFENILANNSKWRVVSITENIDGYIPHTLVSYPNNDYIAVVSRNLSFGVGEGYIVFNRSYVLIHKEIGYNSYLRGANDLVAYYYLVPVSSRSNPCLMFAVPYAVSVLETKVFNSDLKLSVCSSKNKLHLKDIIPITLVDNFESKFSYSYKKDSNLYLIPLCGQNYYVAMPGCISDTMLSTVDFSIGDKLASIQAQEDQLSIINHHIKYDMNKSRWCLNCKEGNILYSANILDYKDNDNVTFSCTHNTAINTDDMEIESDELMCKVNEMGVSSGTVLNLEVNNFKSTANLVSLVGDKQKIEAKDVILRSVDSNVISDNFTVEADTITIKSPLAEITMSANKISITSASLISINSKMPISWNGTVTI